MLQGGLVLEVYRGYMGIPENHLEKAWNGDWKLGKCRPLHDLGYCVQGLQIIGMTLNPTPPARFEGVLPQEGRLTGKESIRICERFRV